MFFKVVIVVSFEEYLDLLSQEGKELFGGLGNHQFPRDGDFRLSKGERCVAIQSYRADPKIRTPQVDC